MDSSEMLESSMRTRGKHVELIRKKNEASLLQNEIWTLESELRELEMVHEDITPMEETSGRNQGDNSRTYPEEEVITLNPKNHQSLICMMIVV